MDLSPMFTAKKADAGKVVHDMSQALMSGSVSPVHPPRDADDSVKSVIAAFNKFVSSGEDPYKFPGFARMRFSDYEIERAEPYIRQMLRRGFGAAYLEAGKMPCDTLASVYKKSRYRPRRLVSSSICDSCTMNNCGRCSKVKVKLSSVSSVIEEDVENLLEVVGHTVPSSVLESVMKESSENEDSLEDKFQRLVSLFHDHSFSVAGELSTVESRELEETKSLREASVDELFYVGTPTKIGDGVDIHEYKLRVISSVNTLEPDGSSLDSVIRDSMKVANTQLDEVEL